MMFHSTGPSFPSLQLLQSLRRRKLRGLLPVVAKRDPCVTAVMKRAPRNAGGLESRHQRALPFSRGKEKGGVSSLRAMRKKGRGLVM